MRSIRQPEVLQAALDFDISAVVERHAKRYELPRSMALDHEREFKRFIYIQTDDSAAYGLPVCLVDELWHELILDTRLYAKFCTAVLGTFLHHEAGVGLEGRASYSFFLSEYVRVFGADAPKHVWPRSAPGYSATEAARQAFLRSQAKLRPSEESASACSEQTITSGGDEAEKRSLSRLIFDSENPLNEVSIERLSRPPLGTGGWLDWAIATRPDAPPDNNPPSSPSENGPSNPICCPGCDNLG